MRNSLLLLGGIRATYLDPESYGEPKEREFSSYPTWTLGIGNHSASHDGGQSRIELLGHMYDGSMGFSAKWFNAIVGMEAGWVPVENGTSSQGRKYEPYNMFYWNFIDVGFFMDLL